VRLDEPIRVRAKRPGGGVGVAGAPVGRAPGGRRGGRGLGGRGRDVPTADPDELLADEALLREAFGLLVAAHYRTEPNDLARLLDAPNLAARALVAEGRVVAVALLRAGEGRLDAETRRRMYEGERVRGNMVPDVLTSQLRDETAAEPCGLRTVRIATHHALRGEGFGTRLLDEVHEEFGEGGGRGTDGDCDGDTVDYFSVGYGATRACSASGGGRATGRSTSRPPVTTPPGNTPRSCFGRPARTDREVASLDRHAAAFRDRERDGLSDAHRRGPRCGRRRASSLSRVDADRPDRDRVAFRRGASYGPGMYDSAPGAFRDLALAALIEGDDGARRATPSTTARSACSSERSCRAARGSRSPTNSGTSRRPPACGRSATLRAARRAIRDRVRARRAGAIYKRLTDRRRMFINEMRWRAPASGR